MKYTAIITLTVLLLVPTMASADDVSKGLEQFKAGDYKAAAEYYEEAANLPPAFLRPPEHLVAIRVGREGVEHLHLGGELALHAEDLDRAPTLHQPPALRAMRNIPHHMMKLPK